MTKPFSIRLWEDNREFVESLTSDDVTKAEILNAMLRVARDNMEKGIEATTEIKVPLSRDAATKTIELREVLQEINKEMRTYYCEEMRGGSFSLTLSELPCLKDPLYECQSHNKWVKENQEPFCPLYIHTEWRQLLAENLI
jgi:hypothetical protein